MAELFSNIVPRSCVKSSKARSNNYFRSGSIWVINSKYSKSLSLSRTFLASLSSAGGLEVSNKEIYFNHNGDNIAFKSSWIGKDDGLLIRDINNDGIIDNGSELFGNFPKIKDEQGNTTLAKDGFEALKEPDSNNDGIISNLDENFDKLQI